jgi:hypothetical protein
MAETPYLEIWHHEDDLWGGRVNFLLASQAFLIAAYHTLLTAAICVPGSSEHERCHLFVKWLAGIALALCCTAMLSGLCSFYAMTRLWNKKEKFSTTHPHLNNGFGSVVIAITWLLSVVIPVPFLVFWAHALHFF